VLLTHGWGIQRCSAPVLPTGFPNTATNETSFSIGVCQVMVDPSFAFLFAPSNSIYYPGYSPSSGVLTSPVMFDGTTQIGESLQRTRATTTFPVAAGTPAGYPANTTYSNILSYGDLGPIPSAFSSVPTGVEQIFTEIEDLYLLGYTSGASNSNPPCSDQRVPSGTISSTGEHGSLLVYVKAGPTQITNLPLNRRCLGMVQQITAGPNDFPARSFFNMFVQVGLPGVPGSASMYDFPTNGAVLYNGASDPLLIENLQVTNLPPTATYVHGQTTAVPIKFLTSNPPYWAADDVLGYLTLAGHGVFSNATIVQVPPPPCLAAATSGLLDQTLGPVGSPIAPPPIPWLRQTDLFPTPNSSYDSMVNTFVDPSSGITNVLDDVVTFSNLNTVVLKLRDLSIGGLDNPISPPLAGNPASYNAVSTSKTFEYSDDGGATWNPNGGFGSATVTITNSGGSNPTLYNMELQELDIEAGTMMIRESPTKQSLGRHTIKPDPRGFRVSSFFDVFLELSVDGGGTWIPATRSVRLQSSMPPAAPGSIFVSQDGPSLILNWQNAFTLESATDVSGPYLPVKGPLGTVTTGPYPVSTTSGTQMYFRLRQ
jgi:hypothetical protein